QFSFSRNNDFRQQHGSQSFYGLFSLPYGYWNIHYLYARSRYFYDVPLYFSNWRYRGQSTLHRFMLSRLLYRNGKSKVSLELSVNHKKNDTRFAEQRLSLSSPTLNVLAIGLNYSTIINNGYITFNPTFYQGLSLWGSTKDDNAYQGAPTSKFRKVTLSSSYYKLLNNKTTFLSSQYAQWSTHNLYAAERLAIGGEYSVRGFKAQNLSGNNGLYVRNELNRSYYLAPLQSQLALTAAL